jgi:type II secretion system protein G
MKTLKNNRRSGFTLIEIMIVVAIIGVLAAMVIPNIMKASATARTTACIGNLHAIDGAAQQWALETGQLPTAQTTAEGLMPYLGHSGTVMPTCPIGNAAYILGLVNTGPTCPNVTPPTGSHYAVLAP